MSIHSVKNKRSMPKSISSSKKRTNDDDCSSDDKDIIATIGELHLSHHANLYRQVT